MNIFNYTELGCAVYFQWSSELFGSETLSMEVRIINVLSSSFALNWYLFAVVYMQQKKTVQLVKSAEVKIHCAERREFIW